ncbi:radical SAM protein [Chloroflexota bacterium]
MRDKIQLTRQFKARPGEYLSREKGTVIKDWGGRLPIALVYPNSYYLGMSNLGMHTIYRFLNDYRQVVSERAFWEKENLDKNLPLLSIESKHPLTDFAILAFSVSYELDYFNVVKILKASGIPLYASDRDESYPLIIAGGPCITANPMPLSPFFDCLCIGEAEAILPNLLPVLLNGIGDKREKLLKRLASLPGIYVPQYFSGTPVIRQWVENLDDYPTTSTIITPDTELGNLYLIEAERGCNWGCRFCLVSNTFSPMRYRSVDKLVEQAEEGLKYRKRIGLVGPAVADHPRIEEILDRLRGQGAELSISSLRIKPFSGKVLELVVRGGANTIALAPEAGSQRLRRVIRKGITNEDISQAISKVAEQRVKQLKLYFMLGLPSETDEDIEEIIKLTLAAKDIIDRQRSGTRITLNIAPFVPKANTPFQWLPMATVQTLNHRLSLLKKSLPVKGIQIKYESPAWSQVQGVLSRGDSRVAEVLADIEEVSLSGWRKAVEKHNLDIDFYANQTWEATIKLPWTVIESGSKAAYLKRELNKALN